MKKYYTLLFFLLFVNIGFSQNKKIDSLKQKLLNSPIADTTKISLYLDISEGYLQISMDSLGLYAKKAFELSKLSRNYKLGIAFNASGLYFTGLSKMDSARYCFKKAITIFELKKDKSALSNVYSNLATTYRDSYNIEKDIEYSLKAIDFIEDDKSQLSESQFNLYVTYGNAGLEDLSMKFLKLAAKNAASSNNDLVECFAYCELAYNVMNKKDYKNAAVYLDKAKKICERTQSPMICYGTNLRLGELNVKLKKHDEARKYFLKAKELSDERNDIYDIMFSYVSLAENEVEAKNYKTSILFFNSFEIIYKDNETPSIGVWAYEVWAKAEKGLGNYKQSNELLNKFMVIKDSMRSKENRQSLANAEAKYQTVKKDKEIAVQQLELAQNKTQLQKNKTQYSYMTGAALLLLVSSILLWFLYQQRQKRKNQEILTLKREHQVQTLESLMEGEEKERFRIAKELHDGVNGDLSAIKFKLSSLLEMNNTVIKEAVSMIDKSCQQVRAISHNLVPPSLQDFNLIEALEEYCTNMNAIHSPEISFQRLGDAIVLTKKQEANIFRIVQELVNNSIKHAQADEINVQISSRENTVQLTVEDNGKGYDEKVIKTDGIGLKNIQSRVAYLDASLDLVSNAQGTSTTIEIDLNKLDEN